MSFRGKQPNVERIRYEESATHPATPLAGDTYINDGTGSIDQGMYRYDGTDWVQLGSGSGTFNYITQGDGSSVTDWVQYANTTAGDAPDDFGGTASGNVTITSNTTTPLLDNTDLQLDKDAVDRQGEGVYFPFTLRNGDLTSVQRLIANFKTSANYNDDDVSFFVVTSDDSFATDFKVLRFTAEGLPATELPTRFFSETQMGAEDTDARFCIHIASTSASSYTINMELELGPRVVATGGIITDWVDFTPTGTFTTNTTYNGKYRRVGGELEYQVLVEFTGTPNAGTFAVNLPPGLAIDTTKINSTDTDDASYGLGSILDSGTADLGPALGRYESETSIGMATASTSSAGTLQFVTNTAPISFTTGDKIYAEFKVPIKGWGATGVISQDLGSRQIAMIAHSNGGEAVTANVTDVTYSTIEQDTTASWSGTQYTVPETGFYDVKATTRTSGASLSYFLYKNGSNYGRMHTGYGTASANAGGSILVYAEKGDTLSIRVNTTTSLSSTSDQEDHRISIYKVQTPQTLLGSETIAASYETDAALSIANNTQTTVVFEDKIFDTHNAMNTSTGEYTIPQSGIYKIAANCRWSSISGMTRTFITVHVNGTEVKRGIDENATFTPQVSTLLEVNKGDLITVQMYQITGGNLALDSYGAVNFVTINKI